MTTIDRSPPVGLPDGTGEPIEPSWWPAVPGLRFRHWAGPADLGAMTALMHRSWTADGLEERTSPAILANELAHTDDFDVRRDIALAETDAGLVGLAEAFVETASDGTRRYWTDLVEAPDIRGRGVAAALLDWSEARLGSMMAAETGGPRRRVLSLWCIDRATWLTTLVEGRGYRPVRWFFVMVRQGLDDLPDPVLPAGIEVRQVERDQVRRIFDAQDEAFADHWGYGPMSDNDVAWVLEHPHVDLGLWQVAWDGDEIAALVRASIAVEENAAFGWARGWLDDVATRRPWRGRGLATALMARAMAALRARGMTSAGLVVDSENATGALGLYERLGFQVTKRYRVYERPIGQGSG